ncbi:MAG: HAD hydrolase-like protein [Spirochaetes bacterium]|nr:HAD hydrolase-like protein [Spirochaetota bacterium]
MKKRQNYLILFDIDGTILDTNGDGKKAFLDAFQNTWQVKIDKDVNFLGGVDLAVYQELCSHHQIDKKSSLTKWMDFQDCYTDKLKKYSNNNQWHLFPYCREILNYLKPLFPLALVTGNIEQGAKVKLEHHQLADFFPEGGFGEKVRDRNQLVAQAIEKASAHYGQDFKNDHIYLIGDTIKDIESSLENNIKPLLIDHHKRNSHLQDQYPDLLYFHRFQEIQDYFLKNIISDNQL